MLLTHPIRSTDWPAPSALFACGIWFLPRTAVLGASIKVGSIGLRRSPAWAASANAP
ncbi:hypothetical protein [Hydrogenophaga sp.]|uniref:hypothetical protein n=1 Tax=Hydrogenophaga sp. TaxID=1904254 RepID=UPI0025BA4754|nr:hypothetical protein [Hydrogenophaga sp.]